MGVESVGRSLVGTSLDLIAQNQASTGAYVAAPGYDTYAFSWLRDGAFIAAAMDAHRRHGSAAAFHAWVARTIERYENKVELLETEAIDALKGTGDPLRPLDRRYILHTRFTIDGEEAEEHWGEFQLDGYGFWLSSIARHMALAERDPVPYVKAIDLVCRYLVLTWELPCFDSWEEYPTRRHMTTWAAVANGLHEAGRLIGSTDASATSEEIRRRLADVVQPGHSLLKFVPEADGRELHESVARSVVPRESAVAGHERIGHALDPDAVDGSALLVLGAFGPFDPGSDIVTATVAAIEDTLVVGG
ncbi:MAG: glycoside hydrolase family 15 protein, partial [Chloroflexota bacterium]